MYKVNSAAVRTIARNPRPTCIKKFSTFVEINLGSKVSSSWLIGSRSVALTYYNVITLINKKTVKQNKYRVINDSILYFESKVRYNV